MTTIDQKIAEFFQNNFGLGGDWPWGNLILCAIALILCVVLCGMICLEREKRGRSAGCVIHFQGGTKGLTTAGTVWLVMAVGLACGSMNFILALAATLIVMVVLILFRRLETAVTKGAPQFIVLAKDSEPVMTKLLANAKEHEYVISEVSSQIVNNGSENCIETTFKLSPSNKDVMNVEQVTKELEKVQTPLIFKQLTITNYGN